MINERGINFQRNLRIGFPELSFMAHLDATERRRWLRA